MAALNWRGTNETKVDDQITAGDSASPTFGKANSQTASYKGLPSPGAVSGDASLVAVESQLRRISDQLSRLQQSTDENGRRQTELEGNLTKKLERTIERAMGSAEKQHGEKDKLDHLMENVAERSKAAVENLGWTLQTKLDNIQASQVRQQADFDSNVVQKLEGVEKKSTERTQQVVDQLGHALQAKLDNFQTATRTTMEKLEGLLIKASDYRNDAQDALGQDLKSKIDGQIRLSKDLEASLAQKVDALARQASDSTETSRELGRTMLTKMEGLQSMFQSTQVRRGLEGDNELAQQMESVIHKATDRSAMNIEAAVSKAVDRSTTAAEAAVSKAMDRSAAASDALGISLQSKLDSLLNMHHRRQAEVSDSAIPDLLRGIQSKFDMQATHLQHIEGNLGNKFEAGIEHTCERFEIGVANLRHVIEQNVAGRNEMDMANENIGKQMETLVDLRRLSMMVLEHTSSALDPSQPRGAGKAQARDEDNSLALALPQTQQNHNPWPMHRNSFNTPRNTAPVPREVAEEMGGHMQQDDDHMPAGRWQPSRPDSASTTKGRKVLEDMPYMEQPALSQMPMARGGSRPGSANITKTRASMQWREQGGDPRIPPLRTSDRMEDVLKRQSARYGMHTFAG